MSAEQSASREYFYVGGEYVDNGIGEIFKQGQMYVEKLTPVDAGKRSGAQQWPVVLIHGNGQSGTNFLNKPNNTGAGLVYFLLAKKYTVYIIDQTYRGRSPYHPSLSKDQTEETKAYPTSFIEQRFTAPKNYLLWPQAAHHTQWPGTGQKGDATFDAYYSTILSSLISPELQQTSMQAAGAALLDLIGPAILIAHSQGGIYPWLWADVRPSLVKAILSLEPNGPPFREVLFGKDGKGDGKPARKYGIADIPLNFAFPNTSKPTPTEQLDPKTPLETEIVKLDDEGMKEGEVRECVLQSLKGPVRKLVGLMGIPVLVVTAEASYHAVYDRCTVRFLQQAGVDVEWLRLEDVGIHGNGHMFFLEKNSEEIAEVLEGWLSRTLIGK